MNTCCALSAARAPSCHSHMRAPPLQKGREKRASASPMLSKNALSQVPPDRSILIFIAHCTWSA
ncbi:hypothetical protein BD324DRAFT_612430 [Kockovaella imperatae]|uniref:Uncharacterized protein n=1 Tax=Kockovaella imperatae TaxID=4999 RepID=A0A1Y1US81_9TREE|nr:hypothetical protein BD324DRAFT_612430 [Kockovaella imperatae]ORX40880.1 hypothetical protein BD324DRAFT_612430 [Kockovaella imperatae]